MIRSLGKLWIFALIFMPLTFSLGLWQLDREQEKRQLLSQQQAAAMQPPKVVDAITPNSINAFEKFSVTGRYASKDFILDNQTYGGQIGYRVLSLFQVGEQHLLINRGWIPADRDRRVKPVFKTQEGEVELHVFAYFPEKAPQLDVSIWSESGWPKRIQSVQFEHFEALLPNHRIIPIEFRLVSDNMPGAFNTTWYTSEIKPEKHRGYAVQWFGLCFVLSILTVWATIKIVREKR